jgi:transcriptional regulator with XRE-family HTH domain
VTVIEPAMVRIQEGDTYIMENYTFKTFGQALRYFRERNGWSREEAAKALGMTHSGYSRYEAAYGEHKRPSRATVIKYATALNAPEEVMLVAAGYLPDSGYDEHILSPVATWRVCQLKEMDAGDVDKVEAYIGLLYKQAEERRKLMDKD